MAKQTYTNTPEQLIKQGIEVIFMLTNIFRKKTPETNLHIGIHKTATTYLQDQLEASFINNNATLYIPRDEFRSLVAQKKLREKIRTASAKQIKVVISDENILGHTHFISGNKNIYTNIEKRIRNIEKEMCTKKLNIFISLRNIATFLPSAYCEYLRHSPYISFNEFSKNIDIKNTSWYEIFRSTIKKNKKINFYIFKFEEFEQKKNKLIKKISFNEIKKFESNIKQSRQSFTNEEIKILSKNHTLTLTEKEKEKKFNPYSKEDINYGLKSLDEDIRKLSFLSNVTII